ncbi:hypothetical protein QR98_0007380 [Sarcoptes scabiei]|uniref:Uncharacterized protein n=1 Tax=Sarcoptes scabiei TaxID=52283 RepID=A0A131ZU80_SARSC|nr:hypothetical protein QR98_0007380 [Sarcoptes scabiei]
MKSYISGGCESGGGVGGGDDGQQSILMNVTNDENKLNDPVVHYFQTPYALSRLPRSSFNNNENIMIGSDLDQQDGFNLGRVNLTNNNNNHILDLNKSSSLATNGCTMRSVRPLMNGNGDHVYDMPFPPKWV